MMPYIITRQQCENKINKKSIHVSIDISKTNMDLCTKSRYWGQGKVITLTVTVGCNPLYLPLIPASGTQVLY